MNATSTHPSWRNPGCKPGGAAASRTTFSPTSGNVVWPNIPMQAQATHEATVNPTTHDFRRRLASEIAPRIGNARRTRVLAMALATPYAMFDVPRSHTSQTAKYSVATFMEKIVFAKSYRAQLHRSRAGARAGTRASPATS